VRICTHLHSRNPMTILYWSSRIGAYIWDFSGGAGRPWVGTEDNTPFTREGHKFNPCRAHENRSKIDRLLRRYREPNTAKHHEQTVKVCV